MRSHEARELVDSLAASTAAARPIRAGIFSDNSCCDDPGPLTRVLDSISSCNWELLKAADIRANRLGGLDVLIFPGGRGHRQAAALGEDGRREVRDFVRAGGGFVGICAGAFLATAQYEWSLGLVNAKTLHGDRDMPGVGLRSMADRGPATVQIKLTEAGRTVFGDLSEPLDAGFAGGPIFPGPVRGNLPPAIPLAFYCNEVVNYEPQRGTMVGTPSILASQFGAGHVVAISPHPETTPGLEFLVKRSVLATVRKPTDHKPESGEGFE
jgi:glutamine amidotransferase-like uncharacterized protein